MNKCYNAAMKLKYSTSIKSIKTACPVFLVSCTKHLMGKKFMVVSYSEIIDLVE